MRLLEMRLLEMRLLEQKEDDAEQRENGGTPTKQFSRICTDSYTTMSQNLCTQLNVNITLK